jgi:hypothetical protein
MYQIIGSDQQPYGPVSAEIVQQWINERRLNASTLVQKEGTNEWIPLSSWSQFKLIAPPPSAPEPSLAGPPPAQPPVEPAAPQPQPQTQSQPQPQATPLASVPTAPQDNNLATIGLVLSVISIIPCCCGPFGIAGLIVSILALNRAKKMPNEEGKEKAIAGIILSGIGLAVSLGFSLINMANNSRLMLHSHHW